jgi:hypothetical protein
MKTARTRARTFSAVLVSISPSLARLPAGRKRPLLLLIQSLLFVRLGRLRPGAELDDELAIEGGGDARQGVDPRWPSPSLHPGDRRLRGPAELGQFALGDPPGVAPLRDPFGDQPEQLSIIRV